MEHATATLQDTTSWLKMAASLSRSPYWCAEMRTRLLTLRQAVVDLRQHQPVPAGMRELQAQISDMADDELAAIDLEIQAVDAQTVGRPADYAALLDRAGPYWRNAETKWGRVAGEVERLRVEHDLPQRTLVFAKVVNRLLRPTI